MWGGLAVIEWLPYFQPLVKNVDAGFLSSLTRLVPQGLPA